MKISTLLSIALTVCFLGSQSACTSSGYVVSTGPRYYGPSYAPGYWGGTGFYGGAVYTNPTRVYSSSSGSVNSWRGGSANWNNGSGSASGWRGGSASWNDGSGSASTWRGGSASWGGGSGSWSSARGGSGSFRR